MRTRSRTNSRERGRKADSRERQNSRGHSRERDDMETREKTPERDKPTTPEKEEPREKSAAKKTRHRHHLQKDIPDAVDPQIKKSTNGNRQLRRTMPRSQSRKTSQTRVSEVKGWSFL